MYIDVVLRLPRHVAVNYVAKVALNVAEIHPRAVVRLGKYVAPMDVAKGAKPVAKALVASICCPGGCEVFVSLSNSG